MISDNDTQYTAIYASCSEFERMVGTFTQTEPYIHPNHAMITIKSLRIEK